MHVNVTRFRDLPDVELWAWALVKVDGEVICRGPQAFDTEKEARSNVASAKKSMKGASRCKVVTVDAETG